MGIWNWVKGKEEAQKIQPVRSIWFESLEPRLLLSADLLDTRPLLDPGLPLDEQAIVIGLDQEEAGLLEPAASPFTNTELYGIMPIQESTAADIVALDIASFPATYDLRSYGYVTPVKNQGGCGSCWAFACYGSLESSILVEGGPTSDLSENNLKNDHGFDIGPCAGGNSGMTQAYLSRWDGPVSEADDPYHPYDDRPSPGGPPQYYVREMLNFDTDSEMKNALMTYGGLYTHMYIDGAYLNPSTYTYYYNGTNGINHAVTIVGWDDNKAVLGAPGAGAWLIKNSWGAGWADGGYFWLSYYDSKGANAGVSFGEADPASTYETVYYHDRFSYIQSWSCTYGMNKFVATTAQDLTSVVFWTLADGAGYEVRVYDTYSGGALSGLLASTTGTCAYAGAHTVDLPTEVHLTAGNDFYVSLHITNGGAYPLAADHASANWSSTCVANPGESYWSWDGAGWSDLYNLDSTGNFSIKALAVSTAPTAITVQGNGVSIRDADRTPSTADGTDFGSVEAGSSPITRTFTVRNNGSSTLTLGTVHVPTGFALTEGLSASLAAGASDTFTVRLDTATFGTKTGDLTFTRSDAPANPFNFSITSVVAAAGRVGVDDFESYDDAGNRIYETWIDGWTNGTGSQVGYLVAPFAEQTIVHGGAQSMPFYYDNTSTPFYSEASLTFPAAQDWTADGATTLDLYVQGRPTRFVETAPGAFTVSGSGHDIWDTADDFRFVYKQLDGDGTITARVDSLVETDSWAKGGVMIRGSLTDTSVHADLVVTPGNSCSFQWRSAAGGASSYTGWSGAPVTAPYWVRLTRTGNTFRAETSPNGTTWTALGSDQTIAMGTSVYLGLCVSSHNTAAATTAQFSNVSTSGSVAGSWQEVWLGNDPDLTNSPDDLYVAVQDAAGHVATVSNTTTVVTTPAWTEWRIPLSSFAGVDLTRVRTMYIGVGDRQSPAVDGSGLIFVDDIALLAPEITVLGNGVSIADGDTTPSAADNTNFGSVLQGGAAISHTFTVRNDGSSTLTLGAVNVPTGFTLTEGLSSSLLSGASDTFTVRLNTATAGTKSGDISFTTSDSNENPFNFRITGTVTTAGSPEITVLGNGVSITDGDTTPSAGDHTDFGSAAQGDTPISHVFTVRNDGGGTLTLGAVTVPTGFTLTEGLVGSLAGGASDTFTVRLDTATAGTKVGTLYFACNDASEGPNFSFRITGTVTPAGNPEVTVLGHSVSITDGDATPSTSDDTDFGSVPQGGAPVSHTFTVRNDGTATLTLGAVTVPTGFTLTEGLSASLAPGASDTFTVRLDTATTGTKTGDVSFSNNDGDENPFNFRITGTVSPAGNPEITVLGNGVSITDGDATPSLTDHTSFGSVVQGSAGISRTFTVCNDGTGLLTLGAVTVPTGFTLTEGLAGSLAAGASDTFTVRLDTVTTGTKTGTLYFACNDASEGPNFSFKITGTVVTAGNPEITVLGNGISITDGDSTPSTTDGTSFGSVAQGGTGISHTFTVRNDGTGTLTLGAVTVPTGFTLTEGLAGSLAAGASDTFTVRLDTATTGTKTGTLYFACNDANEGPNFSFKITGTVTTAGNPEITVLGNGVSITDGDSTPSLTDHTSFGSVAQGGAPIARTYTVRNDGTATLTLGAVNLPTGFTLTEGLVGSLAAGASDTFTVRLDTTVAGTKVGTLYFACNDASEGPNFSFRITGTVVA